MIFRVSVGVLIRPQLGKQFARHIFHRRTKLRKTFHFDFYFCCFPFRKHEHNVVKVRDFRNGHNTHLSKKYNKTVE